MSILSFTSVLNVKQNNYVVSLMFFNFVKEDHSINSINKILDDVRQKNPRYPLAEYHFLIKV